MPVFFAQSEDSGSVVKTNPIIEAVLSHHTDLPICNTIVTLRSQEKQYSFRLAYRYNKVFLRNRALKEIYDAVHWHGDLVVMKMGILDTYVSLGAGQERTIAKSAVKQ